MKKINLIIWISILILATACNNEEDDYSTHNNSSLKQTMVTFSQKTDNVSVLVFGKDNNDFIYQKSINSGWSAEGKLKTELLRGYYKFLFVKSVGMNTNISPSPLTGSKFEEIKFVATPHSSKDGYVMPVNEIWLPQTVNMADTIYEILEPTTVTNTLKRAVSQVNLNIKRGYWDGSDYQPLPYSGSENIMDHIDDVIVDISNVGEVLDIHGTTGSANTLYTFKDKVVIDKATGFATWEGPFVFPSSTNQNANIEVQLNAKSESSIPQNPAPINVEGPLKKNEQLTITIWLTSTYKLITITVDTGFMSEPKDGDSGIWE